MGEETMSTWIDSFIDKEKQRREKIFRFKAAFEAFLGGFTPRLEAEVKQFREHFPQDKLKWVPISPGIVELRHVFNINLSAAVKLSADAVRGLFLIEFTLSPQ